MCNWPARIGKALTMSGQISRPISGRGKQTSKSWRCLWQIFRKIFIRTRRRVSGQPVALQTSLKIFSFVGRNIFSAKKLPREERSRERDAAADEIRERWFHKKQTARKNRAENPRKAYETLRDAGGRALIVWP